MTPAEIRDMAAGYQARIDDTMWLLAWHAAVVVNVHLDRSDKVTPAELLGRQQDTSASSGGRVTEEEKQRTLAELKELFS